MKSALLFIAFMFAFAIHGQTTEPIFEKDGNAVKATYFHKNGTIAQIGQFLNGKLNGEWTMFNEQGEKIALGAYEEGQKVGKWFFWKSEGLSEVDFKNSRIANVTQWNSAGTLVVNK